jgi:hypothetical protein
MTIPALAIPIPPRAIPGAKSIPAPSHVLGIAANEPVISRILVSNVADATTVELQTIKAGPTERPEPFVPLHNAASLEDAVVAAHAVAKSFTRTSADGNDAKKYAEQPLAAVYQAKSGAYYTSFLINAEQTARDSYVFVDNIKATAFEITALRPEVKALVGKDQWFDLSGSSLPTLASNVGEGARAQSVPEAS